MKKVLVTGITGFLGSNLLNYFANHEQIGIVGHSRDIQLARMRCSESVKFIPELTSKYLDNNEIDCVIHLAGIAHDLSGKYHDDDYDRVNHLGTAQFFDEFIISKANIFVFVSSIKAVVDHSDTVIDEQFVPKPSTPYGISKLNAEKYIESKIVNGKKVFILRPCMVHGPGNKGNLNLLYKLIKSGVPYPLGAYDNKRSFLSVRNFCFVIDSITKGILAPGTYQLADDNPLSTNQLVSIIAEVLGRKPRIWKLPKALIKPIARAGGLIGLPLNPHALNKLTEDLVVSNRKLLLNLGADLPVSTKAGLIKTIKSFNE